jgi:hypothetical protein
MQEHCLHTVLEIFTNRILNFSKEEYLPKTHIITQTVSLHLRMSLFLASMREKVRLVNLLTEEITLKVADTFHKN